MKYQGGFSFMFNGAIGVIAGCVALIAPAQAQSPAPGPELFIELNTVSEIENGCRLAFLAQNTLGSDLDALVLETVLFTSDGNVERLTLFDFQDLPQGRPRVRQFDLTGVQCPTLGDVLINGVNQCDGENIDQNACSQNLKLNSNTNHEVLG
ncbi:hypothetical protein [Cochlodiniinecator piscidefendens]|uniref:hypothetical protein n=1 Tax=Cochlodiniinecator piscidefendens TaxID=2715756 RepID=UPI001E534DEA|nr:hypothetical protein [Cochlodiniinecator piscidefendens]